MRLLCVEDDPMQRRLMRHQLDTRIVDADIVDQFAAIDMDWSTYSAVILDVMMPVHDGPLLVQHAASRCAIPPIILYSAMAEDLLAKEYEALADFAVAYVPKLDGIDSLLEMVSRCAS